jgi:hypothetical protein
MGLAGALSTIPVPRQSCRRRRTVGRGKSPYWLVRSAQARQLQDRAQIFLLPYSPVAAFPRGRPTRRARWPARARHLRCPDHTKPEASRCKNGSVTRARSPAGTLGPSIPDRDAQRNTVSESSTHTLTLAPCANGSRAWTLIRPFRPPAGYSCWPHDCRAGIRGPGPKSARLSTSPIYQAVSRTVRSVISTAAAVRL